MRRLCVLHHRHEEWVPALREAEPRLEVRGWHPRNFAGADRTWLAETEALFCWRLPEGTFAALPRLAWIQCSGAGVEHLVGLADLPPRVVVTRADGRFGFWMARYVLGHLLEEAERIPACRAAQAEARWDPRLIPENLGGAPAVVFGFGRIGRTIGLALRSIGMEVAGIVREARPDPEFMLCGARELPGLLASARLLVLAAPSTPATRGLVDDPLRRAGNPGLTLVNVGRGDLVDPGIILEALDAGRLGRAVLDVFPEEPLPQASPLWNHPRVTVTPHHSGPSTPADLIPDILGKLRAYAEGHPIPDPVDRGRGY